MTALRYWLIACALCIGLTVAGVPIVGVVLVSSPFAALAGWHLIDAPRHTCGWCGRRWSGQYEWCCPDCERFQP